MSDGTDPAITRWAVAAPTWQWQRSEPEWECDARRFVAVRPGEVGRHQLSPYFVGDSL